MTEDERTAELLRLNEESRQNVELLHAGELTEEVFVARMEAIHASADRLVNPHKYHHRGNGAERK